MSSINDRLESVAQEPLTVRASLGKFFRGKAAPITLRECMKNVCDAVGRGEITGLNLELLEIDIEVCYRFAADKLHQAGVLGLVEERSEEEIASLAFYTCKEYYSHVNKALRSSDRDTTLPPHVDFIWLFMHALRKCPKYEGHMVYRGMKGNITAT